MPPKTRRAEADPYGRVPRPAVAARQRRGSAAARTNRARAAPAATTALVRSPTSPNRRIVLVASPQRAPRRSPPRAYSAAAPSGRSPVPAFLPASPEPELGPQAPRWRRLAEEDWAELCADARAVGIDIPPRTPDTASNRRKLHADCRRKVVADEFSETERWEQEYLLGKQLEMAMDRLGLEDEQRLALWQGGVNEKAELDELRPQDFRAHGIDVAAQQHLLHARLSSDSAVKKKDKAEEQLKEFARGGEQVDAQLAGQKLDERRRQVKQKQGELRTATLETRERNEAALQERLTRDEQREEARILIEKGAEEFRFQHPLNCGKLSAEGLEICHGAITSRKQLLALDGARHTDLSSGPQAFC